MKTIRIVTVALCALLTLALVPNARTTNLSGQYAGTVTDSVFGSGTAVANLVTNQGGMGGWFGFTFGTASFDDPVAATTSGDKVSGAFEAAVGSSECRFTFNATFDRNKHTLRGKYAVENSGDGACYVQYGKFALKQQCYYESSEIFDVRPAGGPMHC